MTTTALHIGVTCGNCSTRTVKIKHATADDVRECYAERRAEIEQSRWEIEHEEESERAYDRMLEARAERAW